MDLKRISADEAKKLMEREGYTLLDVRSAPEFAEEHPAGALNVPFLHKSQHGMVPNPDFTRVVRELFPDPSAPLLTSCQMGGRSVRAAAELKNLGYTHVIDVRGGFGSERDDEGRVLHPGWKDAGLPVEQGDSPGRSWEDLRAKAIPPQPEAQPAPAPAAGAPSLPPGAGMNRFASDKRTVKCAKLGQELPGLKRRPYPGPLGERIFEQISAEAWNQWVEHSKMVINEYRINSSDPNAVKVLMEQCEAFLFGGGASGPKPEGYVPEGQGGGHQHY